MAKLTDVFRNFANAPKKTFIHRLTKLWDQHVLTKCLCRENLQRAFHAMCPPSHSSDETL